MVGGGRRGHVAAARKTGASESWRATAGRSRARRRIGRWVLHSARGAGACAARVRCVGTLSLSLRGLVCSAPFKGACHSLKSSACTRSRKRKHAARLCVAAVAVLYCGREHGECSAGCGHRFPTAGSGSTHRRLSLRPRRQNQPRRVQVLRMRECHAAYVSPIQPMRMAHANGRNRAAHSGDRSDRIRSDKIG